MLAMLRAALMAAALCAPQLAQANPGPAPVAPAMAVAGDFGQRLAAAALAQTWVPALYDPSYRKIAYPGGDVPWYIGVCTDVVVRAYRALGLDLQELVHKARAGSGDTNIDHRRVEVLRTFFKRHGQSLPVGNAAAAFKPGDLVSYHLPNGTFSKTHIAIVSARSNADGVPLIIHNRGFGVQEEDWLFAEKITGHYRYAGPGL